MWRQWTGQVIILQTSDLGVQVQAFTLGCFLGKKHCSTLSLFTHPVGRTNNYPLKGGGGRVGTLLTEGLKKSPVPSHPSYWLKLTFYLAVICFNYKGMVPIHNIHLINQYYSNMFAVFIV